MKYIVICSQRPSGINNFQYQSDKEWVKNGGRHKDWPISDGGWLHSRQYQVVDNYCESDDFHNNGHLPFDLNNFNRAGEFGQDGPSDLDISSVVFLVDQPKVLQLLTLILHSLNL